MCWIFDERKKKKLIKLLNDPYRMEMKFKNKLIVKKNKIKNSRFINSVRVNQFTKAKTNLVIEFYSR